jgi:hypothetical protein
MFQMQKENLGFKGEKRQGEPSVELGAMEEVSIMHDKRQRKLPTTCFHASLSPCGTTREYQFDQPSNRFSLLKSRFSRAGPKIKLCPSRRG